MTRPFALSLAAALLVAAVPAAQPFDPLRAVPSDVEGQQPQPQKRPVFRGNTQVVSVDVIVRDGSGGVVRGLTAADFEVTEDGKPQEISSFTFEEISDKPAAAKTIDLLAGAETRLAEDARRSPTAPAASPAPADAEAKPISSQDLAGRRLIVLLFDISSMQPEDVQRAVDSATKYVNETMSPADMVAVATVSSMLDVLTDFTGDKTKVGTALARLGYTEGTATAPPAADTVATDEQTAADETTASDDTVAMDMFNNDVRLRALKALAETLAPLEQKKSILYFSAGMERSGEDNQVELRAAINAAVRAHVAIYPVDTRGLQAVVPGGNASQASGRGTALFSGRGVSQQFSRLSASQGTLVSLASDTGGRAFTDSNDFGDAFKRVQRDMSAYYLLGYNSANLAKDGRFRRIRVRLKKQMPGARVEARQGYYADRDFAHTARGDRETQLQEMLFSAVSATDLPVLVNAGFFRLAADRYYVPISMAVPGSAIPLPAEKDKDKVELDVLGLVQDEQGRPVGRIRQTMKLPPGSVGALNSKQVLYQSAVTLPPGRFSIKVVVRENTSGLMGSFEAPVIVPELKTAPLKVSSVVLSTQVQPAKDRSDNPLVRNGEQLVPNLTHVAGKDQKLLFYYEVYDPASADAAPDVRTSLAFYRGKVKVFETPVVERATIDDPSRKAAVFKLEVPGGSLPAGLYTCQINIIDSISGKFAFPRLVFLLR
jgi:VWFA-related protein